MASLSNVRTMEAGVQGHALTLAVRGFDETVGTDVLRQLGDIASGVDVECLAVRFLPSTSTRWHRHAHGQVLLVVAGTAIVTTTDDQVVAAAGSIVVAEPGEWHRHGATEDGPMVHLAIHRTGPDETDWRPGA